MRDMERGYFFRNPDRAAVVTLASALAVWAALSGTRWALHRWEHDARCNPMPVASAPMLGLADKVLDPNAPPPLSITTNQAGQAVYAPNPDC